MVFFQLPLLGVEGPSGRSQTSFIMVMHQGCNKNVKFFYLSTARTLREKLYRNMKVRNIVLDPTVNASKKVLMTNRLRWLDRMQSTLGWTVIRRCPLSR